MQEKLDLSLPDKSKKSVLLVFFLLSCGMLLICAGCSKNKDSGNKEIQFEYDKSYERGHLTVHVKLDRAKVSIADTVLLELSAAIDPNYEVKMPALNNIADFGIVDRESVADRLDEHNNIITTRKYRLEPLLSGKYTIPSFKFEFYDVNQPDEKRYELSTEPVDVEVTSLLGEDRSKLEIADIEGVIEMPMQISYQWLWAALMGLVIVAILAYWLYLRKKQKSELIRIFKSAHEIAYDQLRELVNDNLLESGEIKKFYERISDILRRYIENRFEIRAPERTTEEFLFELQHTEVLPESDKKSLGEFLNHCDLVKFAKYSPTTEQIQRTFDLVKEFIEKTKQQERKIDVTDKTSAEQPTEVGSA